MARKSMRRSKASRRAGAHRSRASRRAGARRSRYGGQIMHQLPPPFNPATATQGQIQFANAYANKLNQISVPNWLNQAASDIQQSAPSILNQAAANPFFGSIAQGLLGQKPTIPLGLTGAQVMSNFSSYGNAAEDFPSMNSNDFANSVGRPDFSVLLANPNDPAYSPYISMLQHPDS